MKKETQVWLGDIAELLKKFRILAMVITLFFGIVVWDMWLWFKVHQSEMTVASAAAYTSLSGLAAGAIAFVLRNVVQRHEKDNDE